MLLAVSQISQLLVLAGSETACWPRPERRPTSVCSPDIAHCPVHQPRNAGLEPCRTHFCAQCATRCPQIAHCPTGAFRLSAAQTHKLVPQQQHSKLLIDGLLNFSVRSATHATVAASFWQDNLRRQASLP
jgi:polyferredoxin